MKSRNYKDLIVWQKSMKLALDVYALTRKFPQSEIYGLTSQMRRSSVSIPANIAEGSKRSTDKDFAHFLSIAYGSSAELATHVEIAKQLSETKGNNFKNIEALLEEVMKMLNVFIQKLKTKN